VSSPTPAVERRGNAITALESVMETFQAPQSIFHFPLALLLCTIHFSLSNLHSPPVQRRFFREGGLHEQEGGDAAPKRESHILPCPSSVASNICALLFKL